MALADYGADYNLALQCGVTFVKDYYLKYAQSPEDLTTMYGEDCHFCHHLIGQAPVRTTGVHEVAAYLCKYIVPEGPDRKVTLYALDAIPSEHGSVLVVTKGIILTPHSEQEFNQTFLLRKITTTDYCIVNDVMQLSIRKQAPALGKARAPPAEMGAAAAQGSPKQVPMASAPVPAASPAAAQQMERCAAEQQPKQPKALAPMSGAKPTPAPAKQPPQKQQPKPGPRQPAAQPAPECGGKFPSTGASFSLPTQSNKQQHMRSAWEKRQQKNLHPAKKNNAWDSKSKYLQMCKSYDVHFPALGKVSSRTRRT